MDVTKYPQYELYLLTLNLFTLGSHLIPEGCDERCISSTIINRAYFSSYLYCLLWLEDIKHFKPIPLVNMDVGEKISEHKQVRNALGNFGEKRIKDYLSKLSNLRKKADYNPFVDLTPTDVSNAIHHMKKIFNNLQFD